MKRQNFGGRGQSKCGVSESMYEVEKEKGKANRMMEARERENEKLKKLKRKKVLERECTVEETLTRNGV